MKIIPSVLAEEEEDFLLRIRQAEAFVDYVQIDFMDAVFVPTKSVSPEEISAISTSLHFELHLMAEDPLDVLERASNPSLKKVLFHFESRSDPEEVVSRLKAKGLSAGLAIRPETSLDAFREAARGIGTLLFLTVDPGKYGSPFREEVIGKVAEARQLYPDKIIEVDGGVSLDNLHRFVEIGVDNVCVGSRIFLDGKPGENYRRFTKRLEELESAKS
jgi:ribulose-phosphate 3-epimerase